MLCAKKNWCNLIFVASYALRARVATIALLMIIFDFHKVVNKNNVHLQSSHIDSIKIKYARFKNETHTPVSLETKYAKTIVLCEIASMGFSTKAAYATMAATNG